jgi:hypothetical protein
MSNQRISELTTSSVPIKATDFLEVSVYNGSTYDTKKVNSEYLKPYKVYSALISQSGTSAPTVTVLENTIGTIVWARSASGDYNGTLTGAFTASKTFAQLTLNYVGASVTGYSVRSNNNVVLVQTIDASNTGVDSKLNSASLEIRVYQ